MKAEVIAAILRGYMRYEKRKGMRPRASLLVALLWKRPTGYKTQELCALLDCDKSTVGAEIYHLRQLFGRGAVPMRQRGGDFEFVLTTDVLSNVASALAWAKEEEQT